MPRPKLDRGALLRRSAQVLAGATAAAVLSVCSSEDTAPPGPVQAAPASPASAQAAVSIVPSEAARARLAAIRARLPSPSASSLLRSSQVRFDAGVGASIRPMLPPAPRARAPVAVELTPSASGTTRITDAASHLSVAFTMDAATDAPIAVADGMAIYEGAAPGGGDLLHRVDHDGVEDLVFFDQAPAREELRYRVDVSAVAGLRLASNTLEFLDAGGTPRLRIAPPYGVDAGGARIAATLSVEACAVDTSTDAPWDQPVTAPGAPVCTVVVSWRGTRAHYPVLVDPYWKGTGMMAAARFHPTATLLNETDPKSKVLIAGGFDSNGTALDTAELYEPLTRTFSMILATMTAVRGGHTATLLAQGGEVLLVGCGATASDTVTERFRLVQGIAGFTPGPSSAPCRRDHIATLLTDGRVLIAGGANSLSIPPLNTSLLYDRGTDPGTDTFADGPLLKSRRRAHAAVRLGDGRVMISGGFINTVLATQSIEIYTPGASGGIGSFALAPSQLIGGRAYHSATLLNPGHPDAHVLIAGGATAASGNIAYLSSAELFVVNGGTLSPPEQLPPMSDRRVNHTATLLTTGDVILAGGFNGSTALNSADLYSAATKDFSALDPPMAVSRQGHAAALVTGGDSVDAGKGVLVAGGGGDAIPPAFPPALTSGEVLLKDLGEPCSQDDECFSNHCTTTETGQKVCCDLRCIEQCYSCTEEGKQDGGGPTGTCGPAKSGTPLPTFCINELEMHYYCDGEGKIAADPTSKDCKPGTCGANNHCVTYCGCDDDCSQTGWCNKHPPQDGGVEDGGVEDDGGEGGGGEDCGSGEGGGSCFGADAGTQDPDAGPPPGAGRCEDRLANGFECTRPRQCKSNYCIDGYCCESICNGPCQACDVVNNHGKCLPIGTDEEPDYPHYNCRNPSSDFPRPKCAGDEAEGNCRGYCGGKLDGTCKTPTTDKFAKPDECTCSDEGCEKGATLTKFPCDGQGSFTAKEDGCPDMDGGFRCASENACKTSCTSDTDCILDFICVDNSCVKLITPTCDGDRTLRIPDADDEDCTPYRCHADAGNCSKPCKSVDDCVPGSACSATGECKTPSEPSSVDSCSCRVPGVVDASDARTSHLLTALGALLATTAAARRRRRRRAPTA